jgi:hypothetical protein
MHIDDVARRALRCRSVVACAVLSLTILTVPAIGIGQVANQAAPTVKPETSTGQEHDQAGPTPAERAAIPITGDYGSKVDQRWRKFLDAKGFHEGVNPGDVFLAYGKQTVDFDKGTPGWVEARPIAFELAQLKAKVAMVRYLGQKVERDVQVSLTEHPHFEQGYIDKLEHLGQPYRVLHKLDDLTEATLDKALSQLDTNYNPEKYGGKALHEKEAAVEQLYQEHVSATASQLLVGALTFDVIEGPSESGNDEILVGVIWTPNLARLASAIDDREYAMPPAEAGDQIRDQLPRTVGDAVASFGSRVIINEKGERALLGYGQAEPANVVGPRQRDTALEFAMTRAEQNAAAAITAFVGEKVTLRDAVNSEALTRDYTGLAQQGSMIDINSVRKLTAATRPVELNGIETVWRQIVKHPETGQDVAVAAVVWSPEGLATAKSMGATMSKQPGGQPASAASPQPQKGHEPIVIERRANDSRAF